MALWLCSRHCSSPRLEQDSHQTDAARGDVTPESRRLIEDFVENYFIKELDEIGKDRVLWFKNWVSLQSVRGVDHVHVLVKDAPAELITKWTERKDL